MRFHSRSYQTLPPASDGRIFGELTLLHTFNDAYNNATAYICCRKTPDAVHHLVYNGPGMSLNSSPQLVPVNLTRLDGPPVLTGHYMVDIITGYDGQDPAEHFIVSGRQTIPLTGYRDLKPADILGTASAPLLRVPLKALAQHDEPHDITAAAESLAPNIAPITSEQSPTELLHRLDDNQRGSFRRL